MHEIDLKQVGIIMAAVGIPGVSIATISGREKPSTIVLGKDTASQSLVTPETVFGAASLSKPLFAYLVLKLIEANKFTEDKSEWLGKFNQHFDLDTPLKDILPYAGLSDKANKKLGRTDKERGELLTASMVLSHQTGLHIGKLEFDFEPGSSAYDLCLMSSLPESGQPERNKLYINYNKENDELRYTVLNPVGIEMSGLIQKSDLDKIRAKNPTFNPNSNLEELQPFLRDILDITSKKGHTGSGYCGYSGIPFGYLQKAIEKLTGSTLEELAQEFVFKPLHMDHSSFAKGYDLCLMSSLPKSGQPERNKLYIEYNKENNELRYTVLNPSDIGVSGLIEKSDLDKIEKKIGVEKFAIFLAALKTADLNKLQPFLTDILDITSAREHTRARHAANSLHTTASDYALFCAAWMNDKNKALQDAFIPAVFMMNDKVINDQGEPSCEPVSHDDLKRVAYGLGWELQTDDKGVPIMAYHTGDMNEWRATVAMNLKDKTATVYFSNSHNGHILQDLIISPKGELENGLNFFRKYNFARTPEELKVDWREKPSWGMKRDISELKAESTTQLHKKRVKDAAQSSASSSRSSRSVIIGAPSTSDYPRASQNNMSATSKMDSDPNKEYDDAQPKKSSLGIHSQRRH